MVLSPANVCLFRELGEVLGVNNTKETNKLICAIFQKRLLKYSMFQIFV